jgi:hypothetical protein
VPEADFLLKLGDNASSITSTLLDASGDAVDIQGATIRWKLAPLAGGTVTIDDTAVNGQVGAGTLDGTIGQVGYSWATVPATPGRYLGEWETTFSGGSVQTFPNDGYVVIDVLEDL